MAKLNISYSKLKTAQFIWTKVKPLKKEEMTAAGLVNFGTYCKDPCFVKLSQTIVSYTRTLIPHCNAVLKMYSEELYYPIIDSISELLRIIINVLTDAMRNVRDDDKSKC